MLKLNKNAEYSGHTFELYQKIIQVHTEESEEFSIFKPDSDALYSETKYNMAPAHCMLINAVCPAKHSHTELNFILKIAGRENLVDIKNIPCLGWFNFDPKQCIGQLTHFSIKVNIPCLLSVSLERPI